MILDRILAIVSSVHSVVTILDSFQQGSFLLQHGKNVVEVTTRKPPVEVWLSLENSSNIPICNGDINKVSYSYTPTGFILYADVVSDTLQVNWQALFDFDKKV